MMVNPQPMGYSQFEQPCLILNFDVNQTLVLKDTSKGMDSEQMLISILAEYTNDDWDGIHGTMSFKDYVCNVLLPGDKSDQNLKKERQKLVGSFLAWLEVNRHPAQEFVLANRDRMRAAFTDPDTQEIKFSVFNSFFFLLKKLRENHIRFIVILRTFGNDLKEVTEEISVNPSGVKFGRWGKFEAKKLHFEDGSTIEKVSRIFEAFLHSDEHFAIQDNWKEWNADGERARSGKQFIFDSNGHNHEVRNLSLFFDDNFTGEEKDIISPADISGKHFTGKELEDKMIFKVNPVQAILDENYYIRLVNHALQKNGYFYVIQ